MVWQPADRQLAWYHAVIAVVVLGVGITGGVALATTPADAQAGVTVDGLNVADVNRTVSGNVTDVVLDATLTYTYAVPDGTDAILTLRAGDSHGDLETLTFRRFDASDDSGGGTVTIQASLLELDSFTGAEFQPPVAGTKTVEGVVQVSIEVRRANGPPVTRTITTPLRITLHDDATLTASIGGDIAVNIQTN